LEGFHMSRQICGICSGLLVGAAVGFLLVLALALLSPRESWTGWTSYPTLASVPVRRRLGDEQPVTQDVWHYMRGDPQARFQLFLGLLLGGGFGALTGATVSIGRSIARAVRETRAPAPAGEGELSK
jgi:hypothetical protein